MKVEYRSIPPSPGASTFAKATADRQAYSRFGGVPRCDVRYVSGCRFGISGRGLPHSTTLRARRSLDSYCSDVTLHPSMDAVQEDGRRGNFRAIQTFSKFCGILPKFSPSYAKTCGKIFRGMDGGLKFT